MAAYDFRCRVCDARFEVRRPVSIGAETTPCPAGHDDVARVWTAVAVARRAGAQGMSSQQSMPSMPSSAASGCCGGGCCS